MFEWRLIIGSKQKKTNAWTVYAILKSLLSPLHKTHRSWMDVWMGDSSLDLYECIIYNEIIKWDPLLNPWVHYINSMWNPRVSWVWEFNSISFIVGLIKWRNEKGKKKKKPLLWASRRTPTKRWCTPTWRWPTHLCPIRNVAKQIKCVNWNIGITIRKWTIKQLFN